MVRWPELKQIKESFKNMREKSLTNPKLLVEVANLESKAGVLSYIDERADGVFRKYPSLEGIRINVKSETTGSRNSDFRSIRCSRSTAPQTRPPIQNQTESMNTTTLFDQGRTLRRQRKSGDAISY